MNDNATKPAWLRILLDVVMIVLAASLFSRNAVSLVYHEIAGLALAALFVTHLILNRAWLKKLFSKRETRTARMKFIAVLDCLMALAWLAVMVTGVLTSRRVFALRMTALDPWHDFAAAAALLLTGVHLGMNWRSLSADLRRVLPLPKAAVTAVLAVVLAFGCYNLFAARYVRWFAAPFTTQQTGGGRMMREFSTEDGDVQDGQNRGGRWNRGEDGEQAGRGDRWNAKGREGGWSRGQGGMRDGQEREGGMRNARDGWGRGGRGQRFSFVRLLRVIASYGSLTVLFAAATHGVALLAGKKKKETPADGESASQTEEPVSRPDEPASPPEE